MPGRTVRTASKRKFEELVAHIKYFDGLSLPTRLKKRPGVSPILYLMVAAVH
jgi:hypothetical protein